MTTYTHDMEIKLDALELKGEIAFGYPTVINYTQDAEFNIIQRERIQDIIRLIDLLSKACNEIDHIEIKLKA